MLVDADSDRRAFRRGAGSRCAEGLRSLAPSQGQTDGSVSPDAVLRQTERILASELFLKSKTPLRARFLRCIVEETLRGRKDELKETVIALEVFGFHSFDPRLQTNVRVEGSRLRQKLRQYYEAEGREDSLLISLPEGGYVPHFGLRPKSEDTPLERVTAVPSAGSLARPADPTGPGESQGSAEGGRADRPRLTEEITPQPGAGTLPREPVPPPLPSWFRPQPSDRRMWSGWVAALAMGLIFLIPPARNRLLDSLSPSAAPQEAGIAVLPIQSLSRDPGEEALCLGLTHSLTGGLVEMERFQHAVWVVPAAEVLASGVKTAGQARGVFGAEVAIMGTLEHAGDRLRLTVGLHDTMTRKQLYSTHIEGTKDEIFQLEDLAFRAVADMLRQQFPLDSSERAAVSTVPGAGTEDFYLQGRGYLQRGSEGVDQAILLFQRASEADPRYAPAHAGLCDAYLQKYQDTEDVRWITLARKSCKQALVLDPLSATVKVSLSLAAAAEGRYEESLNLSRSALQSNPRSSEANSAMANAYEKLGRLAEAEKTYLTAISLHQGSWRGYSRLAAFYYNQGRYLEAERYFLQAHDLAPDNPLPYNSLGGLYIQMGRYAEAEGLLKKSLELHPNAVAYNNLGAMYFYQGRYTEAAAAMEKALQSGPRQVVLLANLARAYRWSGETGERSRGIATEAIRLAQQELTVNPGDAEVRGELAMLMAETGDLQGARREIREALRLDSTNRVILYDAVVVFELAGDRTNALRMVAQTRKGGPPMEEIERNPILAALRRDERYQH